MSNPDYLPNYVDQELRKICPIDGVVIHNRQDRSTWRVFYKAEATQEQKDAAQDFINNLVFDEQKKQEQIKKIRNDNASKNLSLRGCFRIEKRLNPALTFSDYLDQLESEVI